MDIPSVTRCHHVALSGSLGPQPVILAPYARLFGEKGIGKWLAERNNVTNTPRGIFIFVNWSNIELPIQRWVAVYIALPATLFNFEYHQFKLGMAVAYVCASTMSNVFGGSQYKKVFNQSRSLQLSRPRTHGSPS